MKEALFDDGGGKNVVALGHGWLCSLFANRGMQRIVASLLLLTVLASLCPALVSTNVPLDHWSYTAVDKLADYALIDSAMLTTRPISRIEMARHIGQAMHRLEKEKNPPAVLLSILDRLQKEFEGELILIGVLEGSSAGTYVKPVEDPYMKYLYARREPDIENVRGDVFRRGSNYRTGFASRGTFFDLFAFYLHPEYIDSSEEDADVDLIEGYGKAMAGPIEFELGKDSLWWGPGRHGSILMSNNAAPLTMIKVTNPQPIQLPWIFRAFGPFRMQWFLAELEEDRDFPEARFSGIRLNIKPHPSVELGASRVMQSGGRGMPRVDVSDYARMFLARTEQEENNQIAGFDASVLIPLGDNPLLRSFKFYGDTAGEDEAAGWPSKWSFLLGLQLNDILRTGRTDLRFEYADTHQFLYEHSVYTSGYTYEDRVMGHHVGPDARDLFVQLSHYLMDDLLVDVAFDWQTFGTSTADQSRMNILECNLTYFPSSDWQVRAGYRYETGDRDEDNHIFQIQLIREF
ncbi:MAG: capsule assembly Wzi family protein [Planctomycetaceae bacterium]|nr:MAG: capsule assembly Wzi family protein [Planctomycetaceae bacterium]